MRRFFFLCPDDNTPYGGIKIIYRHVEVLNNLGFEAYVYHLTPGFKINWFKSNAPIVYPERKWIFKNILKIKDLPPITKEDLFVLPEYNLKDTYPIFSKIPYIVFNQSTYGTFTLFKSPKTPFTEYPPLKEYLNSEKIIVVSHDGEKVLKNLYPTKQVDRVILSIENFKFSQNKEKIIAFSPAKELKQALIVISLLQEKLNRWTFIPLINMNEEKVSETMQKTAVYLNFTHPEGFGLPAAEAIKSGAIVVGYDGRSSAEFMKAPFAITVTMGDLLAFRDEALKAVSLFENEREKYNQITKEGAQAMNAYNDEAERNSILSAYSK